METKSNIRRLLAGSSFVALLAASHPALAAGNVISGTNAGPITINTNFDFVEVTGIIDGSLTLNSHLSNTAGEAGFELNGGSIYGDVTNTNQISVTSMTNTPAVGMLAHANGFDFITGNLTNEGQVTVFGQEAAAGILAFGSGLSIGGDIQNTNGNGFGIKVRATQTAHSGTAVAAGIFVDVPTVYGDVSNSGSIKVNSNELSYVHPATTTDAHARGDALAYATGVGVGGHSSFQGLTTLSRPSVIDGSVSNSEDALLIVNAHAAATHIAVASATNIAGLAHAVAGGTIDGKEAEAYAFGVYASGDALHGNVGNSGTIISVAVADAVNSAVAHGQSGRVPVLHGGSAFATANGHAYASAAGAGATGNLMNNLGPLEIYNDGSIGVQAVANTTNVAKADTKSGKAAIANAHGSATAQATGLYDNVGTLDGSLVNGLGASIASFATAASHNTASVIDPTRAYNNATATAAGGADAEAFGMRGGYNDGQIITDGIISNGNINASAMGNTYNTATVDVKGHALAQALGTEDGSYAQAIGVNYDLSQIEGHGGTGISYSGTIVSKAVSNSINTADATGQALATGVANGRAEVFAAGTSGYVDYLAGGYLNKAKVTATGLANVHNMATADASGTSLGHANVYMHGEASANAVGLNPTIDYLNGAFVNGTGGSLHVAATAHVANTATATGGTAGDAYAVAYGTARAAAFGINLGSGSASSISGSVSNFGKIDVAASAAVTNAVSASGDRATALAYDGYRASHATAVGFGAHINSLGGNFYNSGSISAQAVVRPSDSAVAYGGTSAKALAEGAGHANAAGISLGFDTGNSVVGSVQNVGHLTVAALASGVNYAQATSTSGGIAEASVAGHMVAHAAGFDIGGGKFDSGISNSGVISAAAIAGSFNGEVLSELINPASVNSLGVGSLSALTGLSFAHAGQGGAFATGTSLARAYASGYARADAKGLEVSANSIGGGVTNAGNIHVMAAAITTNEAQAFDSGNGNAYAFAYGYAAHARGTGISISAPIVSGGIDNSSYVGVTVLSGSVNIAKAEGVSLGLHDPIASRAGAAGDAYASGLGIGVSGQTLNGAFTNSGRVDVLAGALVYNSAVANSVYGPAYAGASDWRDAFASASGVSVGFNTVVGAVDNSGDVFALGAAITINRAVASGTSYAIPIGGIAQATGVVLGRAQGVYVGANSVSGTISNSGSIDAGALGLIANSAYVDAGYAKAYARIYGATADASGFGVDVEHAQGGISNSNAVTAVAYAGTPGILLGGIIETAVPNLGNSAVAYGYPYAYAYARAYADAHAKGLDIYGGTIGYLPASGNSIDNSGAIKVGAFAGIDNLAKATAEGEFAKAYAEGYSVVAQGTGIKINAHTIDGSVHNSGQIGVSVLGKTTNTAHAVSTGNAFAGAIGSAYAAGYGLMIGNEDVPSIGGSIVNDASLIHVQSIANSNNVSTAKAGYAETYAGAILRIADCGPDCTYPYRAVYAGAYANATGISAHASTIAGDFTNNGAIHAFASANSFNSANSTGVTYAHAYGVARGYSTAQGVHLFANSIGGDVMNTGAIVAQAVMHGTANANAKATGGSYGYGYAYASAQGGRLDANAVGFVLNASTLAGSFTNTTGGSMSIHGTAIGHTKAKATGETRAYASASGEAYAQAYGIDLSVTVGGGDFVNEGAITAVAHGSAVASALANSTRDYASAYGEVEGVSAYAGGLKVGFDTLHGGFTNDGVIIAKATADAKVVSSAVGASGALASAEGTAYARAFGIDFHSNSMGGSFANNAAVWATAHAHANNQAIAHGSSDTGYAYGSEDESSETQAKAYAYGISATISNSLVGNFTNSAAIHANALATSVVKATATGVSSYGTADSNSAAQAVGVDLQGNGAEMSSYGGHIRNSSSIHALAVALASATVAAMSGFAAASANARATGFSIGGVNNIYGGFSNDGVSLSPALISAVAYATGKAHSASVGVDLTADARAEAVGVRMSASGSLAGGFSNSGTIRGHAVANAVATDANAYAYATGVSLSVGSIGGGILNTGTIEGTAAAHAVAGTHGSGYGIAEAVGMSVAVTKTGIDGGISNTGSILANALVDVTGDFHIFPGSAYATALYVEVQDKVIGTDAASFYNSGTIKAVASDPAHAQARGVVLNGGSYAGNLANVGAFSSEDGVFRAWTGGVIEADAHATVRGNAVATALLLEDQPSMGAASFGGELQNSGLIKAKAVSANGSANATAIKLLNGAYFDGGIANTGVILAQATGTSTTTVAINADAAGKGMVIQQIGQLGSSDNVIGGIFGDIRTNNGYTDKIVWSGGQIVGDIHGDTGDSLTVFGGLGYKTAGDYHFVYNSNINASASDVFDGSRFGEVNVNDAAHSDTAVSLEVSGNLYLDNLNVNHNGTLVVDSLTTKIDTTTLNVAGGSNVAGITWNLNNVLVANQGQPIIAAGTVNIGEGANTVAHMASNGLYKATNDYYAIGVGNYGTDFNGTFGTLQNDFSTLYTVADKYVTSGAEQGYHIEVTRISFASIPGMTKDGTNFGTYLDQIVDYLSTNDPNGPLATLLSDILTGSPADYAHGVNELSGHQNADMLLASLGDPSQLMNIIFSQLGGTAFGGSTFADLSTLVQVADNSVSAVAADGSTRQGIVGANAGSPVQKDVTVWARAFGSWASLDRNAAIGAAGFSSSGGGAVVGGDYKFSDTFKAGIAGGFQRDNVDFHGAGHSDVNSYSLSAYARAEQGPIHVNGLLGYAFQKYTMDRYYQPIVPGTVYSAHRSPSGKAYYAGFEAGYDYDLGNQAKLEPFAGFLYSHTTVDGSTETGSGPANLTIQDQSANSASSRIGVRWSQTFGSAGSSTWTPMLELGWKHEFADANPTTTAALAGIPGASFTVQGAGAPKDAAMVGAGITAKLTDDLDGTVQYNGDFSSKYNDSTASVMVRLKF